MTPLLHQRCFNHALREAVARCPECGRFFCRECVTEHDDRVICATCLRQMAKPPFTQRAGFLAVLRTGELAAGLTAAWVIFYLLGLLLVSMPNSFHEGTLWKASWMDDSTPNNE